MNDRATHLALVEQAARHQAERERWQAVLSAPGQHLSPHFLHLQQFRARQHERMRRAGWPVPGEAP